MRNRTVWLAAALLLVAVVVNSVAAQPPPGRGRPPGPGGPGGRGGPGGPLERAVDDFNLSEEKHEEAFAAIRAHRDNVERMREIVSAGLLLKMKEVLSTEEFKTLKDSTDKLRAGPGGARRVTNDDVVERIMSFDKNKQGKVTKDDLPERMQYLVEKGDTNKDGALDRDEIKKLAAELAKEGSSVAAGPGGRGGPSGPSGRGGPGGRGPGGRPGPGNALTLDVVEKSISELKLPEKKKEMADSAIKAHREEIRNVTTLVRAELLFQMSEILNEDQLKKFTTVLNRQPGVGEQPIARKGPPKF